MWSWSSKRKWWWFSHDTWLYNSREDGNDNGNSRNILSTSTVDSDGEESITFNLTPKIRTRLLSSSFPEGLEEKLVLLEG